MVYFIKKILYFLFCSVNLKKWWELVDKEVFEKEKEKEREKQKEEIQDEVIKEFLVIKFSDDVNVMLEKSILLLVDVLDDSVLDMSFLVVDKLLFDLLSGWIFNMSVLLEKIVLFL